jgi:hypothetical protein
VGRSKKGYWVITDFENGNLALCLRCGETLCLNLPQATEVIVSASKAFIKVHEDCKEELIGG